MRQMPPQMQGQHMSHQMGTMGQRPVVSMAGQVMSVPRRGMAEHIPSEIKTGNQFYSAITIYRNYNPILLRTKVSMLTNCYISTLKHV